MNINVIETVVEVSRRKSFLEAAYALNYTPAVVSKHVARAEEELGVRLFFRGNKASAVALTPECEAVIDELVRICQSWRRVENTITLRKSKDAPSVRIGVSQRAWNYHEDEIIGDFIQQNPDITVETVHGYTAEMLEALVQGRIDGMFITAQHRSGELDFTEKIRRKYDCEFFHVMDSSRMYLAISDQHPLARQDEADFADFADFTIAINSDRQVIDVQQKIEPFLLLSRSSGVELKYTNIPTTDASAYRVARNTKLAIPVPDDRMRYEGIKYIRLRDWPTVFSFYFVTMRTGESAPLARFKQVVRSFRGAEGAVRT